MRAGILLSLALTLFGCGDGGLDMAEFEKQLPRRVMDPPSDLPDWSQTQYVRWASAKVSAERAIIIDVGGGAIDKHLDVEAVSDILNADYRTIFLHPRARPSLTHRFGWPSITLLDEQGCMRANGSPSSAEEIVTFLQEGLKAREEDVEKALPAWKDDIPAIPPGGGEWTVDAPDKAAVFTNPDRGAPAVLVDGKPYVYGNRDDAALLADKRPAAEAFLDSLPEGADYLSAEGPVINCPKPTPPRPAPVVEETEDE